ncbi:hypothetical protein P4S72_29995 [Vibrio sp. PP-XX7]
MSDLFKHRFADEATTSRSHRIGEALNYRRSVEVRHDYLGSATKSPRSSGQTSSFSSPSASSQREYATTGDRLSRNQSPLISQTKLTLDDFRSQEQDRADYHGESASETLAQEAYDRYLQNEKPTAPIRRAQSDPLPVQDKLQKTDKRTFDDFMQEENDRASYYGEVPNTANAEKAYRSHLQSLQQPSFSWSEHARSNKPQVRTETATAAPYAHDAEMERIKSELDAADYYGTQPNVTDWERRMYESSQRPVSTGNEGLRRHQSASPVMQENPLSEQARRSNVRLNPHEIVSVPHRTMSVLHKIVPVRLG